MYVTPSLIIPQQKPFHFGLEILVMLFLLRFSLCYLLLNVERIRRVHFHSLLEISDRAFEVISGHVGLSSAEETLYALLLVQTQSGFLHRLLELPLQVKANSHVQVGG